MNFGIYSIRHIESGKVYIGRSVDIHRRKLRHFTRLKKGNHENKYLQLSYIKYGLEAFEFKIIEYVNAEFIVQREQWWMDLFGAYIPECGYNISPSSIHSLPIGFKHSEETRLKISKGLTGKKRSPEVVAKHKALMTGRKSTLTKEQWEYINSCQKVRGISDQCRQAGNLSNTNRVWSEASKQKMSASKTGVVTKAHLRYNYTVETPEGIIYTFNHLRKFAKENGLSHSHLASMINNGTYYKGWTGYKVSINIDNTLEEQNHGINE